MSGLFSTRGAVALVLAVLLSACAHLKTAPAPADLKGQDFLLRGKLGIAAVVEAAAGSATRSAVSLNFRWLQRENSFDIQFWGPLGQGRSHLVGDGHTVALTTPDGRVHRAREPEALMQRWVGWSVPIEALKYWVQGRWAPLLRVTGITRNQNAQITGFEQLGWSLHFSRYRSVATRELPVKVIARNGSNRLLLVTRGWQFGPQITE